MSAVMHVLPIGGETAEDDICAPMPVMKLAQTFHQLERAYRHLRRQIASDLGFSQVELTALLAIGNGDAVTPGAVSEELGLTSGAVTAVLDRLALAGYLRRKPHPSDRRRVVVSLTARGEEVFETIWERHRQVLGDVVEEAPCLVREHTAGCLRNAAHMIIAGASAP